MQPRMNIIDVNDWNFWTHNCFLKNIPWKESSLFFDKSNYKKELLFLFCYITFFKIWIQKSESREQEKMELARVSKS